MKTYVLCEDDGNVVFEGSKKNLLLYVAEHDDYLEDCFGERHTFYDAVVQAVSFIAKNNCESATFHNDLTLKMKDGAKWFFKNREIPKEKD